MAAATYDSVTSNQLTFSSFGALRQTLTYNANGTVATTTDGNSQTTTLSNWYRGTPRTVQYPGGVVQSAEVNAQGWLTSVTDENGFKTCFAYDTLGRLAQTTYPSESVSGMCDTSTWSATTLAFEKVAGAEYGIPAGHWRQIISTGNARKISYFDGQWRPLVTWEYDTADVAGTQRFQRFSYDHEGRVTFASYPGSSDALTTGAWTEYDVLGRVEGVSQDSELGLLTTLTSYEVGFRTKITDPRGNQTTTGYLTFDQPSADWPVAIVHPGGAFTDIARDAHGKPLSITRRNVDSSLAIARNYAYNGREELCRAQEPETNATLMGYDGGGNLKWSSAGLAQGTNCEESGTSAAVAARRVDRTYDGRNRLLTLMFPNGAGNQVWTYTPDGLPASVSASNPNVANSTTTQYSYNRRRLTTQEILDPIGGSSWPIIYAYNSAGHLSNLTYPTGLSVAYSPNALGQPSQAGSFATGVQYYPNGAIKQFTYGNGIVHTMAQNARQLPSRTTSCATTGGCATPDKRLDLGYTFDANGNVANIVDHADGRQTRGMSYDGLDRLTHVTSNMFGTATYAYDVLDNLTQVAVTAGDKARTHDYCYDSNWRMHFVRLSGCSGAAATALGYDVQGNLSYKNSQNYNFDFGNRMREVVGKEWYAYDGYGRRVVSCNSTHCAIQQYSQSGQILYVHDDRNNKRVEHVYLAGSLVALRERPAASETVTVKYQHTDALGTPVAVTDAGKAFMNKFEYEPYGQLVNSAPLDGPGFTGHVQDAATGLTYMQQRYYDPQIGMFLSVDPVSAYGHPVAQFNRYRYANSNPLRFSDPDGRCAVSRLEKVCEGRGMGGGPTAAERRLGRTASKEANTALINADAFRLYDTKSQLVEHSGACSEEAQSRTGFSNF
jgi:RHS repeat-associated protein